MSNQPFDTDVVVIGTGPAGATTALALATYGISVRFYTQFNGLANSPRAHITNQRAVEVLREFDLEEEAKSRATPWQHMGESMITTSLIGEEIARIQAWGTGDLRHGDYVKGSPSPLFDLVQPEMEALLVKHAVARGANLFYNTEYLDHEQDDDGVRVWFLDRMENRKYSVRAKYLVGMDGARSKIVEKIGLPIEGHMARAGTTYVRFKADLTQYVQHRPSILHWIVNPAAGFGEIGMGLLRAISPWNDWVAGWGFDIAQGEPQYTQEQIIQRIHTFIGTDEVDIEVQNVSAWYVNQAFAQHYSVGRVFCGGDAVHRHPPSSGLGSNTCIQDAFNLAWKLAFVIKDWAKADLLSSYSDERVPVGQQIVARANQSRMDYKYLKDVFGFDQGITTTQQLLDRLNAPTADAAELRTQLNHALEIKNFEFNAQGVELNQRYQSVAVVLDDECEEQWQADPQLYLQATSRLGAKIPHCWLIDAKNGQKVSTLDIVGNGKLTLVTGLSGTAWEKAADQLNLPYLNVVTIGQDVKDVYGIWQKTCEIAEAGMLLVRPDGYVAWRHQQALYDDEVALQKLTRVLEQMQYQIT
ncbi:2,4-dichlorophenol 6-monooxygenase [Acinetobacter sp. ANC 4779]|uniref:FAD-dependent monooxygenase n=1 Tax=Acinetobacter sp. ANC 4779 TaxID=2529848 RepID=UPI00103EBB98|nr:FAD-dependent monooxygenase [Acinetobacter sp. ANC 4779]TCB51369.1 2,4-dichlorophenol 6-monooxygenase [Acinetobacter sp. ANC 4779]